jgi:hypothetical protein
MGASDLFTMTAYKPHRDMDFLQADIHTPRYRLHFQVRSIDETRNGQAILRTDMLLLCCTCSRLASNHCACQN